jgi:glycosyltransferase involved in cell wall biosynthesis
MTATNIAIVIPALNEEDALRHLLPELFAHSLQWIIVVDNNSTDATARVAREAGAIVVQEFQPGYGSACWRGFTAACELGAEIVVFMDGDGSDDPADLALMLEPLLNGRADLVIGSRVSERAERDAILPQARLGNWLVCHLVNIMYRVRLHDIGSFRAIRCTTLKTLHMREMTYGWPVEMLVKAARAGYRIVEVSIHYRRRTHGRSKVAGTLRGTIKAAYCMLSTTFRYSGTRRRYV